MPLTVGTPAPPFVGTDVHTGQPFSLQEQYGKIVIIDFSYIGCDGCELLFLDMAPVHQHYLSDPCVQFVIVHRNVGLKDGPYSDGLVANWTAGFGLFCPTINDWTGQICIDYEMLGSPGGPQAEYAYPTTFILCPDLAVAHVKKGTSKVFDNQFLLIGAIEEARSKCAPTSLGCGGARVTSPHHTALGHVFTGVIHGSGGVVVSGNKPIPVPPNPVDAIARKYQFY